MQFRQESDDLPGIPERVPTPAGREICHHIQVELHTSPLLLQVPARRNTTLEMLNAIYLCWFIVHLLTNKYNLTIPWAGGRHCGKAAFFPFLFSLYKEFSTFISRFSCSQLLSSQTCSFPPHTFLFLSFLSSVGLILYTVILAGYRGRGTEKYSRVTTLRKAFSSTGDQCELQKSVSQETNPQVPYNQRILISYNTIPELLGDHSWSNVWKNWLLLLPGRRNN